MKWKHISTQKTHTHTHSFKYGIFINKNAPYQKMNIYNSRQCVKINTEW